MRSAFLNQEKASVPCMNNVEGVGRWIMPGLLPELIPMCLKAIGTPTHSSQEVFR